MSLIYEYKKKTISYYSVAFFKIIFFGQLLFKLLFLKYSYISKTSLKYIPININSINNFYI